VRTTAADGYVDRDQRHTPRAPDGYQTFDRTGAVNDLLRPLKVAVNSISIVAILLWIVVALIVGSVVYLSALERLRDFAVFKAIGVRRGRFCWTRATGAGHCAACGAVVSSLHSYWHVVPMVVVVPPVPTWRYR